MLPVSRTSRAKTPVRNVRILVKKMFELMFLDFWILWAFFYIYDQYIWNIAAQDNIRHQVTTDVSYQMFFLDSIQNNYKKSDVSINFRIFSFIEFT